MAGGIVLNSIPTIVTVVLWILSEVSRGRGAVGPLLFPGSTLGLCSTGVLGVLAWRTFDLLSCAGYSLETWRYVALTSIVLLCLLLVGPLGTRFPRVGILLGLSLSAGAVVCHWAFDRYLVSVTFPVIPVQNSFLVIVVALFARLRKSPLFWRRRSDSIDSLATRDSCVTVNIPPSKTHRGWHV